MAYKFFEEYNQKVTGKMKQSFQDIIVGVGENPEREGIVKTPERAAKAMQFLTQGYKMDAEKILNKAKI